jgi:hypothetical protein
MHASLGSVACLGILIATDAARAQLLIDDFEQDGFALEASNQGTDIADASSAAYFGGLRSVFMQGFGGAVSTAVNATGAGDDALVLTTGGGANVLITYGNGMPNADLSAFAAIEFVVTAAPSVGQLSASFGNLTGDADGSASFDGPGTYSLPFAGMDTTGGFDFTSVDRIYAAIGAPAEAGQTFAISEIRLVPEAGASCTSALGALAAIAARSRRRKRARS